MPSRALQESIMKPFRDSGPAQETLLDHLKSISGASREALRSLCRTSPLTGLSGTPSEYLKSISGSSAEPSKSEL